MPASDIVKRVATAVLPKLLCVYTDGDDNPIDITGFSPAPECNIKNPDGTEQSITGTITDAANGQFEFAFSATTFEALGDYEVQVEVFDTAGDNEVYDRFIYRVVEKYG